MGVRDYFVPESFILALHKIKGFKDLPAPHQARMAFYVWIAGTSRRVHKKNEDAMSIGYMDLERGFGRGGFKIINERLNIFEITKNWWWAKKLTKAYQVTSQVKKVKDKYLAQSKEKITRLITLDGKAMRTLPEAIAAKDLDGVTATAWKEAKPFNAIPVDLNKMQELHEHLEIMSLKKTGDLFHDAQVDDVSYRVEILGQLIRLAQTDVAGRGFIIHRYAEGRTGRLYARGITLQTAPRLIRKAALHGLYDYDVENCHYAIFSQLAARFNYECKAINHYLTHKKEVREGIAKEVGITQDKAKMCLLALMFGARLSEWEGNAIPLAIGAVSASALFENTKFMAIANDILEGRKVILSQWPKRRTTLLNDMDKAVSLKEPANVRLAHIIQGLEAKALRAAIRLYPDEVVLLMHDGFVSKRALDVPLIEEAIYQDTGIRLEMAGELIALPADLDFSKV
jgi:hypothetical protein